MEKHTPGPWWLNDMSLPARKVIEISGNSDESTHEKDLRLMIKDLRKGKHYVMSDTMKYNAKLIIAAPILLEACQHVFDNLVEESIEVWAHEIAHLKYAIDKARGEE